MMDKKRPIGVFDSGIGGLTVLKRLAKDFPNEDFIYIADTKFCPYGKKTKEDIENRVLKVGEKLIELGVKAIVIACNTATANMKKLLDLPNLVDVIGVIEPTANMAYNESKNKRIAVLATDLTIKLGVYQKILEGYFATIFPVSASRLVDIVEQEDITKPEITSEIEQIISPLKGKDIDVIIYGCTHFGLLDNIIAGIFPNTNRIECAIPTSKALSVLLENKKIRNDISNKGTIQLYDSENGAMLKKKIGWFDIEYIGPNTMKI